MKKLSYLLLLIVVWSCNQSAEGSQKNEEPKQKKSQNSTDEEIVDVKFNYNEFVIGRNKLGGIEIGMTISEAEEKFEGLKKKEGRATNFGYGGGSPAYLYYDNDDLVFGLTQLFTQILFY